MTTCSRRAGMHGTDSRQICTALSATPLGCCTRNNPNAYKVIATRLKGWWLVEYLVKFQFFAPGAANIEVFNAFVPEIEEHGGVFEGCKTGLFKLVAGGIDIGNVEGDVVNMAIFSF